QEPGTQVIDLPRTLINRKRGLFGVEGGARDLRSVRHLGRAHALEPIPQLHRRDAVVAVVAFDDIPGFIGNRIRHSISSPSCITFRLRFASGSETRRSYPYKGSRFLIE